MSFQSRFGPAGWLKPYTLATLAALPARGIHEVSVVCPGFAVDCLETLEEIAVENRAAFLARRRSALSSTCRPSTCVQATRSASLT